MVRTFLNNQIFANLCSTRDKAREKYDEAKQACSEIEGYEAKLAKALKDIIKRYDEARLNFAETYILKRNMGESVSEAMVRKFSDSEAEMFSVYEAYTDCAEQLNKLKELRDRCEKAKNEYYEAQQRLGIFLRHYVAELVATRNQLYKERDKLISIYEEEYGHWYYLPYERRNTYFCVWCQDELSNVEHMKYIDVSWCLDKALNNAIKEKTIPENEWPAGLKDAIDKVFGLRREITEIGDILAQVE